MSVMGTLLGVLSVPMRTARPVAGGLLPVRDRERVRRVTDVVMGG